MGSLIDNVQDRFRASTNAIALFLFKSATGLIIGLTIGLIGQELVGYGWISLLLVTLVVGASVVRVTRFWNWTHMLIFNLICVLIGMVLRMYILIAPG